jgi:hypothetical protein
MRRIKIALLGAGILSLSLAAPALAGQPRTTVWVCDVPDEGLVNFVTAAEAARHGITQADSLAGSVFAEKFGEDCSVT